MGYKIQYKINKDDWSYDKTGRLYFFGVWYENMGN